MATHSSVLAWETPWREEPGGLESMGSQELDTTGLLNLPTYLYCWIIRFPFSASLPPSFLSFLLSKIYLCIYISVYLLSCCSVTKLCLTFLRPQGLPASSVHGILQARIQEWVAISSSRECPQTRDQSCVTCIGILYHWATWEAPLNFYLSSIYFYCYYKLSCKKHSWT